MAAKGIFTKDCVAMTETGVRIMVAQNVVALAIEVAKVTMENICAKAQAR